tara:strand:- start:1219 stop:2985 length:1767 start_codon:yes stop_codon:yes gene_type:complete
MTTEEQSGKGGNGKEVKGGNEEGNVPFMISEMQREMNAQCTQLQLNFKREHEENVKEKEKMRDSIERLTKIKDDLMKSLTLMTKERDSFREKAMGEKLLHFPSLNIKEEKRDERDDFYDNNTEIDDDDEFKEEEDSFGDGGKNNEDTQTLVSRARFQKLQAELMIYREAAAKYRKEKEVALSKLEKYERKQQQQQQQRQQKRGGGKEENTAKRKRPHSPASKYAVFAGEVYTTKDEELEEIGNRRRGKDDEEEREKRQRRRREQQHSLRHRDEINDVDDEYSARKKNDKKTDDDEKSFSFNRTEDFWAFDKKNETTIKSNAFVNPQRQQQEQEQRQHHQTDKPKPKKHVDASKMMIMSKRASLEGASKKGTAAASTAAKKGVSKKVRGLWNNAMKKKTTTISDTKTSPPPRSGAMFETPKTNEAQINENTPGEEEVLVIKNTQEEEEKEEKEVKRTKQELREDHQQKSNKCLLVDKPLREVKYQEVVRGKEARKELIGYACQECERFYAVAGQLDRRACEHGSNALNNNTNNGAPPRNLENSRHRAKYVPPKDPAGYWDLGGFTQTQPDPKKRKATKFDETPPSQENL